MKSAASLVLALLFGAAFALPSDIAVARSALGDGLSPVAERHAAAAEKSAADAAGRDEARLVRLEALARAGRHGEMLTLLDGWSDSVGDAFRYWRAWALAQAGERARAQEILRRPFEGAGFKALACRLLARIAVMEGDRDEAERSFRMAAELLRGDVAGKSGNAVEWARSLWASGAADRAWEVLKSEGAIDAAGAAGDAARLLGADLRAAVGDARGAEALLRRIVSEGAAASEGEFVAASCSLFDSLWRMGATNDAMSVVSGAVARATRPELVRRAGFAQGFAMLSEPGRRAEGFTNVVALIRRFPGAAESRAAQRRLAETLLAAGDGEGAVREYGVLLESYPEFARDPEVLEARGWAYLAAGRRAEAAGAFARAAQFAETNAPVRSRCRFKQGDALLADGRHREAADAYSRVDAPRLALRARYQKGDALMRAGMAEEAAAEFRSVMLEGGEYGMKAGLRLAAHESSAGHPESAIELYDGLLGGGKASDAALLDDDGDVSAVRTNAAASADAIPDRTRAAILFGRGRAYYLAYRWAEAEADFAEVAKLQPERLGEMKFLSALCRYGAGHDGEAVATVRGLLASTPESHLRADLVFWLAKYDAAHKAPAAAFAGFSACATNRFLSSSRRMEAHLYAIRCARSTGDYPKALELVKTFMQRPEVPAAEMRPTPETPLLAETLLLQGALLKELARFAEAVLVLDRAKRLPAGDDFRRRASVQRADCLLAMGADDDARYRNAIEEYRSVQQDAGLSPSLRLSVAYKIGLALEKLRRSEEAVDQFYTNVVMAYEDGVANRVWFDGDAVTCYARAVMKLADYYESRGEDVQARRVLGHLANSHLPSADEARRRVERLERKGNIQ